ncbi:MAG: redoxin domain-containing protein [Bacteroidales bacterium]|nr:redoxin domain-containing protein [Bacteroidales bacterium]
MRNSFKQLFFTGFFLFAFIFAQALPTSIRGSALEGKGMFVRLTTYTDRISFEEEILAISEIDEKGHFKLDFDLETIHEVYLKIGNQSFSFFAEAGKNIELTIEQIEIPPKSALSNQKRLRVIWTNGNALNEAIDNFNYTLSIFLEKNFIALYKYRDSKLLQDFALEIDTKLKNTSSLNADERIYFEHYIAYQLADLKLAARINSNLALGNACFKNKNVLYNQPNYMTFFHHYFNQYFLSGKRNTNYNELVALIQSGSRIHKLLDYIGQDDVLEQERLREFVLLFALKEIYYSKDFKQEQIQALIKEIADKSAFVEHKKTASAILDQLTRLEIGSQAPDLSFKSTSNSKLDDYAGRYVYLAFVSENCPACENDLKLLETWAEKYKSNIAFIEVFVDYTKEALNDFAKQNKSQILQFSFHQDFEALNRYKVRTFPSYFLIDREGKIVLNQSKKPDENLARYFDFLIQRDREKSKKKERLFQ